MTARLFKVNLKWMRCFLAFLFFLSGLFSQAKPLTAKIQEKIKKLPNRSLGIVISKNQTPLYSLNEDKLFTPASLVKIPSLLALYDLYPMSHTFKTGFVSSALIENGILQGDLVLIGGGDPSFTSESLWKLVNVLTRSGIKKVKGRLLIDDRLYKKEPPLAYSERSYSAPSSASSFNWNSVAFYIRPSEKLNQSAYIYANPQNSYIKVINKVKTGKRNKIHIKRISVSEDKEVFELKGTISAPEKTFYRNITNPPMWLAGNAVAFLQQRGIEVLGSVQKGFCSDLLEWPLSKTKAPARQKNCRLLAEWESRPFAFHSYNMMKYSSNLVTRMLVSHIPLLKGKKQGDLIEGMEQLRQKLKQRGLKKFKLIEPSGLSRKNQFSPKELYIALTQFENQNHSPELLFSYPFAQGEGTLKKRFHDLPPHAFLRAKTGSLYGVLSLAGWLESKNDRYRFVFIYNGKQSLKAQELFDDIIRLLSQQS